jgi:heme exporter protein D
MMPNLGTYAFEVLSSYAATLVLIAGLLIVTLRRGMRARDALRRMEEETARHGKG